MATVDEKALGGDRLELFLRMLDEEGIDGAPALRPIPRRADEGEAPASFAQRRLWLVDRLSPGSAAYNVPVFWRLRGALDAAALARALSGVVARHEALRTTFAERAGEPVQVVAPPAPVSLPIDDLSIVDASPVDPSPAEPSPVGRSPINRSPVGSSPVDLSPADPSLVDSSPIDRSTVDPEANGRSTGDLASVDGWTVDPASIDLEARVAEAGRRADAEAARPFDLAAGPLLRARLLRLADDDHVLLLTLHHAVCDAWSLEVLFRELAALYDAERSGAAADLPPLPVQYGDYAAWQRGDAQSAALAEALEHWRAKLAGAPPLQLPADRARPAALSDRGARASLELGAEASLAVRALARREGATPFAVLLAAFAALAGRWAREEDVVVGMAVAGRARRELEPLAGNFVNLLALRLDLAGDPTGRALVARAASVVGEALDRQEVPFDRLVEAVRPERALGRTPLAQVVFGYQDAAERALRLAGIEAEPFHAEAGITHFDLTLNVIDRDGRMRAECLYSTDLFDAGTIDRFLAQYATLLAALTADPERRVSALPLMDAAERARLVSAGAASVHLPAMETVPERFAVQAARRPDAAAVTFGDASIPYRDLDERSNRLARHLQALGVGPETRVGLCIDRSAEMVVAILGVLKAGGAYVPLDPAYPAERLVYVVGDAGIGVLLTQERLLDAIPATDARIVCIDRDWPTISAHSGDAPISIASPGNTAYVIYTSGSTGNPKGCAVTHANVVRLFDATDPWFGFGDADVWTLFHSYAFDFSVWEIWGALLYGGRVVVVPYLTSRSPEDFLALLETERVTVLSQTPGAFRQLARADEEAAARGEDRTLALRYVVFGGEALEPASLRGWVARHGDEAPRLVNMYGITETTVHVTHRPITRAEVEGGASSVIGVPIPDLSLHLLDARGEQVPVGVPGEIHVGGAGVSQGYPGRPGLTAERFVPDPFSGVPGTRLYRSGDLARRRADGELEYLGRIDQQVKVRGFRIEPGEIEAVLAAHPAVRESVVLVAGESADERRLVAFVAAPAGAAPHWAELRAFLAARLPEALVPAACVVLDALPLTPNGKVDRRALLALQGEGRAASAAFTAPRTPAEAALAEVWREVLGVERVGVHDGFFALGGDSIRAIRLLSAARARGLPLTMPLLFAHPTVAALAAELGGAADDPVPYARTAPFSLVPDEDRRRLPPGVEDAYPLARMQEAMLYHAALHPSEPVYHNVDSFALETAWDEACFRRAVEAVVARHPILRTGFALDDFGEPLQLVHRHAAMEVGVADLRGMPDDERARALKAHREAELARPFDLARPPLIRFFVHRLGDARIQFTLTECHAILDGWSLTSTLAEVFEGYAALLAGRPLPDEPPLEVTFRDFVDMERRALASPACRAFWEARLEGAAPRRLPRLPRPASRGRRMESLDVRFPDEVHRGLRRLEREEGLPLKTLLLAAHLKVLSLLHGEREVITGVAMNGRPEVEGGDRVRGLFLNTVPFRATLEPGSWAALARRVLEAEREILPFRRYPLSALHEGRRMEPLFEAQFNFVHFHRLGGVLKGGAVQTGGDIQERADTSFTLMAGFGVGMVHGGLRLILALDRAELADEQVEAAAALYPAVLRAIAEQPHARHDAFIHLPGVTLAALPSPSEAAPLAWSGADAADLDFVPVHVRFSAQAARTPDAVALIHPSGALTYAELNRRAGRLARSLRRRGVGPDVRVGICVERSPSMAVAVLAVLKAGGAYVPLDPVYPPERLAFMVGDSGAALVLTQEGLRGALSDIGGIEIVSIDRLSMGIGTDEESIDGRIDDSIDDASVDDSVDARSLAYVIYTSGSTGRPKGVAVDHGALSAYLDWACRAYPGRGSAVHSSLSFDLTVTSLFVPLLGGGSVDLVEEEAGVDGLASRLRRSAGYGMLKLTPAHLRMLGEQLDADLGGGAECLVVGGEALLGEHLALWKRRLPDTLVVNEYGPTETVVGCCIHSVRAGEIESGRVPIGRPTPGTRLYVLDSGGRRASVGVPGELYIGGAQVARGYVGRAALTAERFVPDPFSGAPGARMYRTGDQARWLADGALDYLGRLDEQVKVRGFRVEPGEIEAALRAHPDVADVAVVAREHAPGDVRLAAYVVGAADAAALRAHVRRSLPEHMVPADFVSIDVIPLTANGKLDRAALPAPDAASAEEAYEAPRTPVEEVLAGIWGEVLGRERVGLRDGFLDLGGHSLLATRVVSRIRAVLGVELPLRALFEAPTLAELAARVEALRTAGAPPLPPVVRVERTGPLPLSFAQERLWFLARMEPDSALYNVPAALRLRRALDVAALERALGEVVRRHAALRTVFRAVDGAPMQEVVPAGAFSLPVEDVPGFDAADREAEGARRVREDAERPFDLAAAPPFRARLLRLAGDDHVLLLTLHHVVSDGWSLRVLFRELWALYEAFAAGRDPALPEPPVEYADYAAWQREQLRGAALERELAYWKARLAGAPALLPLPTDHPRPAVQTHRGGHLRVDLPAAALERLRALGRREGATPFMVLMGAFQALLARYAGTGDVVVGSPIAGRTRREVEGVVGFFVNTLVLRTDLSDDPSFRRLLRRVRDVTLGAYEHQAVPFEKLVEALQPERSLGHSPLFQVMLLLESDGAPPAPPAGLRAEPVPFGSGSTKFDLTLALDQDGRGTLGYATDLFDRATAERMARHLALLLERVAADPDLPLSAVPLLDDAERARVLGAWSGADAAEAPFAPVHRRFAAQAARTPEAVALIHPTGTLTYAELNRLAARLSHALRRRGVGPDVRVGICVERSPSMAVAVLAVLKAGGAYVPLDPAYPPERLAFMAGNSGAALVLTQDSLRGVLSEVDGIELVSIDHLSMGIGTEEDSIDGRIDDVDVDARSLAYVIYTSGSTGRPKGVAVDHGALSAYLDWACRAYPGRGSAVHSSLSFDLTGTSLFVPLLGGGSVDLVEEEAGVDGLASRLRRSDGYGMLKLTPAHLRLLGEQLDADLGGGAECLVVGGEALLGEHLALWKRRLPQTVVVNEYGPTETVVGCCIHSARAGEIAAGRVPIGRPTPGTRLYVLDASGRPAPVGVPGELYIGGAQVARGYIGRAALTAERFVPDPFSGRPGARMYRTGDQARWLADGALDYLGRLDEQVKVRGFRVEPGEIEAALRAHPDVSDIAVVAREHAPGDVRLAAYVVGGADAAALRAHLRRSLPEHMVPADFVAIDAIPLTANGKLDRASLPAPVPSGGGRGARPETELEGRIAALWREVLGVEAVGVEDSFFDLGGHSLLLVRMQARLAKDLGREVPIVELFRYPTVRALAGWLQGRATGDAVEAAGARGGARQAALGRLAPRRPR